ncbi:zinc-dependent metalloprotease [Microbulbifer agarilyticus]|uniref:zinc-dependent metalloprotease n=1 Tax=Microbulbifer agarilyticus TaxID=260552 RepID=UPI001CD7FE59|nr:zinc-dependent metalloprotease [Microbulbifer agarilyticus]MCA0901616.1 zinc-dependent metalloprotease [Microbulbifer agarilyticus]
MTTPARIVKIISLALLAAIVSIVAACGDSTPKENTESAKSNLKPVAEITENSEQISGLFDLYQNTVTGSVYLKLAPNQLNKEIIHHMQVSNGIPGSNILHTMGMYFEPRIIRFEKHFDKIHVRQENTVFVHDKENPVSRASHANLNRPILAALKIEAEDEASGAVFVNIDSLFLNDSLRQLKPSPNPEEKPGTRLTLGKLNSDKTRFTSLHNYAQNTDVVVEYVYDNPEPVLPKEFGLNIKDYALSDERSLAFSIRHILIQAPENDFAPRRDDPRLGYFSTLRQVLTSDSAAPYGDFINRWHLVKKNPLADISEPVNPIVWWIENTTPLEYRDTIRDATLAWNLAFEQAGFKNAIQVKVQPDNADWDAGDLQYNVLRWTASPQPLFGGLGPSIADPRTGQILGADIMLELVAMQNRSRMEEIYNVPASHSAADGHFHPMAQSHMPIYQGAAFGAAALAASGADKATTSRFSEEFLYFLILHEVGHTLGLNHNFIASQYQPLASIFDGETTRKQGLTASVMDYPAPNLSISEGSQEQFYNVAPGAYDRWAIEYGYSPAAVDAAEEAQRLSNILARSTDPALAFGNDADDMRAPGAGIDPRIMINDMSGDGIGYAQHQFRLSQKILSSLPERLLKQGESRQELVNGANVALQHYASAAKVVSRYIGGVMVDRAMVGQEGGNDPFRPIAATEQKRAMSVLEEYVFGPDALILSPELIKEMQQQRRWFFFYGKTEDPKVHDLVLNIQKSVLDHLLNPVVLKRVQDSSLYGNEYSMTDLYTDLNLAIFSADATGNVDTFRQNLQRDYINRLIAIANASKDSARQQQSQAIARYSLKQIDAQLKSAGNNPASHAHKEHLQFVIRRALNPNASQPSSAG